MRPTVRLHGDGSPAEDGTAVWIDTFGRLVTIRNAAAIAPARIAARTIGGGRWAQSARTAISAMAAKKSPKFRLSDERNLEGDRSRGSLGRRKWLERNAQ